MRNSKEPAYLLNRSNVDIDGTSLFGRTAIFGFKEGGPSRIEQIARDIGQLADQDDALSVVRLRSEDIQDIRMSGLGQVVTQNGLSAIELPSDFVLFSESPRNHKLEADILLSQALSTLRLI